MGTRTYYEAFNDSGLYDSDDSLDDFANSYRPAKKSKPSEPDQTTVFSQAHVACLGLTLLSLSEITNIASRHGATVSDKLEPGKTTLVFRGSRLRDKEWRKIQEARIPSAPEENFLMWIAMGQRQWENMKPADKLPAATTAFIQLRLTMPGTKVYRSVQVPQSWTTKHLHQYIQFLFGWTDTHLHKFEKHTQCELYKTKKGEVKSWGNSKARDAAERAKWVGWRERWARGDYNMGDTVDEEDYGDRPIRLSSSDTLYQMFPENSTDIAVKYTYDFGDSWIVHIIIEGQVTSSRPRREPLLLNGKGAPPCEDAPCNRYSDYYRETEPNKKKWQKQAFTGPVFFQYLNGDVACHLGMGSLRVGNKEHVRAWAQEDADARREEDGSEADAAGEDDYE